MSMMLAFSPSLFLIICRSFLMYCSNEARLVISWVPWKYEGSNERNRSYPGASHNFIQINAWFISREEVCLENRFLSLEYSSPRRHLEQAGFAWFTRPNKEDFELVNTTFRLFDHRRQKGFRKILYNVEAKLNFKDI